jgi:SPX domain protein involved in polyphosphate accumulation
MFLQLLDRELERIDNFVVGQLSELRNTLSLLERNTQSRSGFNATRMARDADEVAASLIAVDSFIVVNYNALRRIAGMHDALTEQRMAPLFFTRLAAARFTNVRFDGACSASCLPKLTTNCVVQICCFCCR